MSLIGRDSLRRPRALANHLRYLLAASLAQTYHSESLWLLESRNLRRAAADMPDDNLPDLAPSSPVVLQ